MEGCNRFIINYYYRLRVRAALKSTGKTKLTGMQDTLHKYIQLFQKARKKVWILNSYLTCIKLQGMNYFLLAKHYFWPLNFDLDKVLM